MIKFYKNYNGDVIIDEDAMIVSLWNAYVEAVGEEKIYLYDNDKEFFAKYFDNSYDAAYAVSISGKWSWSDDYVYFDEDGYLVSFKHWNDAESPIDLDKIDISSLIDSLKKKN